MSPQPREPEPTEPPVVRDRRRVNPDGSVREPDPSAEAPAAGAVPPTEPQSDARVADLTETLQRVKAEYDNYRKRTERERQVVVETATAAVLAALLPVLDDLDRARAHGDLTGAFGAVGESLVAITTKLGLEPYGAAGDAFDPQVHDAVMQAEPVAGRDEPVVAEVFRTGYRFAGRPVRPAQVAVAQPAAPDGEGGEGATAESSPEG